MGTTVTINPLLGKDVSIYTGLLASDGTFPTAPATITIDNTVDVDPADTTMTVTALTVEVPAGSYLTFTEPTSGALKTVYVTTTAAVGATAILIGDGNSLTRNGVADAGAPQSIEDGSTATYPPELYDATDSSESNSPSDVSSLTYNSGGAARIVYTSNSYSLSLPVAFYSQENAGARTLARAADSLAQVGVLKILPVPLGYTTPEKYIYEGNVTASRPSAADGVIAVEYEMAVSGSPTRIEAT